MSLNNQPVWQLYFKYKESLWFVVDWIGSASQVTFKNPLDLTDLRDVAKKLAKEKTAVPQSVDLAVTAEDSKDNARQKGFLERLNYILRILLPLEAKSTSLGDTMDTTPDEAGSVTLLNRFVAPKISDHLNTGKENDQSITNETTDNELSPETLLVDEDDVGDWIELSLFLCELDTVSETVYEYWRQAAKGGFPVPLAAWLSTVAFHAARRNFLAVNHISPSFENIASVVMTAKNKATKHHFKGIPQLASPFGGRMAGGAPLIHLGMMLHRCRSNVDHDNILLEAGLRERLHGPDLEKIHRAILQDAELREEPADLIKPQMDITPDLALLDDDDLALDLMLQSTRQLLASKGAIAALEISQDDEHICEPLMVPLRSFLRDDSEIALIPFHLVYGLEFLLMTYKVFLWQGGNAEKPDCRNLALELAKEVQKSILEAGSALESSGKRGKAAKKCGIRRSSKRRRPSSMISPTSIDLIYITNLHGQQDVIWLRC